MAEFAGKYEGIKIFSATMAEQRERLGERVTEWITANKTKVDVVHTIVTQSSDAEFHCVVLTLFYNGAPIWDHPFSNYSKRT